MKRIEWNLVKNELLKEERNVCFEDAIEAIGDGRLLDEKEHPNRVRYKNQRVFVLNIKEYVYIVPYVEDTEKIFLKTMFPSRKETKKYLKL